jgi:hypothetical protein
MFEWDGPSLIFARFGMFWASGAGYSPYWCCGLRISTKIMSVFQNLSACMNKHYSSWAVFFPVQALTIFIVGVLFLSATIRIK